MQSKNVQLVEVGTLKNVVPVPDSSLHCAVCGTPVDDTSESSDDNTNVVNAPREPSVVDQDPGVNISQDPPQIDHNCCYECGDSLNGIFFVKNAFVNLVEKFSDVYQTPPVASMEMLHAQTDLIGAMQNFLKKYDHIPHNEKSIKLLLAEEKFLNNKHLWKKKQTQGPDICKN
ncbi:hypothetical protein Tco_0167313 [Tanacetum coccineum]